MNNPHQNARLTRHSREQIVVRAASGQTAAEIAKAFAVSVRTVRKWLARVVAGRLHGAMAIRPPGEAGRDPQLCPLTACCQEPSGAGLLPL